MIKIDRSMLAHAQVAGGSTKSSSSSTSSTNVNIDISQTTITPI
ncbi:hypothetical protein [Caballeronia sp. GAFFF1]|nr:hypothetical protein [Caballeronia sp. GAFFF1]